MILSDPPTVNSEVLLVLVGLLYQTWGLVQGLGAANGFVSTAALNELPLHYLKLLLTPSSAQKEIIYLWLGVVIKQIAALRWLSDWVHCAQPHSFSTFQNLYMLLQTSTSLYKFSL